MVFCLSVDPGAEGTGREPCGSTAAPTGALCGEGTGPRAAEAATGWAPGRADMRYARGSTKWPG